MFMQRSFLRRTMFQKRTKAVFLVQRKRRHHPIPVPKRLAVLGVTDTARKAIHDQKAFGVFRIFLERKTTNTHALRLGLIAHGHPCLPPVFDRQSVHSIQLQPSRCFKMIGQIRSFSHQKDNLPNLLFFAHNAVILGASEYNKAHRAPQNSKSAIL